MTDGMHGVKLHGNDFKHIEVRARIKITRPRVIGDHLVTNQMKKPTHSRRCTITSNTTATREITRFIITRV